MPIATLILSVFCVPVALIAALFLFDGPRWAWKELAPSLVLGLVWLFLAQAIIRLVW